MDQHNPKDSNTNPQGKKRYKRRIVLINRSLQIKIAVVSLALFFLAAFSVWWEIYKTFSNLSASGFLDGNTSSVMLTISQLNKTIFIKIGLFLGLVWVLTIALSHYIAGPIYRIEASLKTIRTGDLTHRIYLRKFDQLKSTAAEFNLTIEALQAMVKKDRTELARLTGRLEDLKSHVDKNTAEKVDALIQELSRVGNGFTI